MKISNANNTLILHLEGRIDTNNAAQTEQEIFSAVEDVTTDIIVDASALEYISSAGLRVLMKFRKHIGKPLPFINVSRDIYEILETTGFTELLDVKKALRKVSVSGLEVIGQGGHGKVYRLDEETIIKVYHDGSLLSKIEKEREYAKNAFVGGVPSAIAYDVVETEEGYGLVFELAGAKTVSKAMMEDPSRLSELSVKLGTLLKKLNSTETDPALYGNIKELYLQRARNAAQFFTDEENAQIVQMIEAIPDGGGMVHGEEAPVLYQVNHLIYAADAQLYNTLRIAITMTEPIVPELLAQAVQSAAKRFPYFAVKLTRNGETFCFEPNPAPFVISGGGRTVTLGTAESAYHLFAFAYQDHVLYVDTSHFITDGNGSFPFLKTLLYCYLHLLHPDAQFDTSTIALPDSPFSPGEAECNPYPEEMLPAEPFGGIDCPEHILTLDGQPQGYENSRNWTSFRLHIPQKALMSYVSSVDGSHASFVSSLLFRAVSDLHPENRLPVVCGMQHQFRRALGKPFSHLCHVNIVPIEYPDSLRGKDMMKLNTITCGRLIIRADDENDKLTVNRHIADSKQIRTMTLPQKHTYMRKVLQDGIGRNTFEVSYTGRVPWSGLDRYISDISPYLDMTLSGRLSAEIFSVRDEFCINLMQRSPETACIDRVTEILRSLSVPFTSLEPVHFAICGFKVPE